METEKISEPLEICPKCGASDLENIEQYYIVGEIEIKIKCGSCGHEWLEHYIHTCSITFL